MEKIITYSYNAVSYKFFTFFNSCLETASTSTANEFLPILHIAANVFGFDERTAV